MTNLSVGDKLTAGNYSGTLIVSDLGDFCVDMESGKSIKLLNLENVKLLSRTKATDKKPKLRKVK